MAGQRRAGLRPECKPLNNYPAKQAVTGNKSQTPGEGQQLSPGGGSFLANLLKSFSIVALLWLVAACRATPTGDIPPTGTPIPRPTRSARPAILPGPTPPATSPPAADSGPADSTAILGLVGQPDSLNPLLENDSALRALTPLLFESLLRSDPHTARLGPGLAQSWDYEGRRVIFHLPPGLKWSDGRPLTADQVAASLAASRHPALAAVSDVATPDDHTLALTMAITGCAAVSHLAQLPLLPAGQVTQTVPLGSGPFVVEERSPGQARLTLVRNPHYRGDRPPLERLSIRFIEDEAAARIALSEGRFHLVGPLSAPLAGEFRAEGFTDLAYPAPRMVYVAMNFAPRNEAPLPPEVRQALALALDRPAILAEALDNEGQLLAGPLLPGHWAAHTGLAWPEYRPDTARQLLRRAGWRDTDGDGWLDEDGQRVELGLRVNGENRLQQKLGWLISSYYRDVGLYVRAESVSFTSLVDDLFTHDFRLALFSWPILPEPDQRLYWHSAENEEGEGLNLVSYDNPALDELLEQAVSVPGCEPTERAKIYAEVQAALAEDRPVDFLLAPHWHVFVAGRLQGVEPGPFAPLTWNISGWYLQEEEP